MYGKFQDSVWDKAGLDSWGTGRVRMDLGGVEMPPVGVAVGSLENLSV
jgi:hypothetical protein